jgi:hypothetical protein
MILRPGRTLEVTDAYFGVQDGQKGAGRHRKTIMVFLSHRSDFAKRIAESL